MDVDKLSAAFEAILFASGTPVEIKKIASVLDVDEKEAESVAERVTAKFEKADGGIRVIKLNDKYQACSKSEYSDYVRRITNINRSSPLSSAALEVLSIIAYRQPVTKAFVDDVRGVDSREIINGLADKLLIEEKGRLNIPGRPIIYGTTDNFLRCANLRSLSELPEFPEILSGEI